MLFNFFSENEDEECSLYKELENEEDTPDEKKYEINQQNKTEIIDYINDIEKQIKLTQQETVINDNLESKELAQNNKIEVKAHTFIDKKRGRPRKNSTKKIKNKKKNCNEEYRIYNSCSDNLNKFLKKNYKILDIDKPTVTNDPHKSHDAMRVMLKKSLYELYCDIPLTKRIHGDKYIKEKDAKKRKEIKQKIYKELAKNKKAIDNILKNNNKEDEILFKEIKFQDFLIAYLNNENEIIKRDKENKIVLNINLNGFETYNQFFNGKFTPEEKEKYKYLIFGIINNTSCDRKKKISDSK